MNENSELINDYSHNAKNPVYNLRFLVKNKINRSEIIIPKLDIKLRDYEIKNGEKLFWGVQKRMLQKWSKNGFGWSKNVCFENGQKNVFQ